MSLARVRAETILLVLLGYLVLNEGFMLLRLPPGSQFGVPFGELLILLVAATFVFDLGRWSSFIQIAPIAPLLVWWIFGLARLTVDFDQHGVWALRDATHVIESGFLWVGYVAAAAPMFLERFSSWLRLVLNIGVFYSLLYPFREALVALSPKVWAPAGYFAPIFFNYNTGGLLPLTAAMGWLVDRKAWLGLPAVFLAGVIIVYSAAIFQMRTTYLQLLALLLIMMMIQPRIAMRMTAGMMLGIGGLVVLLASGIEITGRLGEQVSLKFFLQHFAAIWGEPGEGAVHGAAGGVSQRLGWWSKIWSDLTANPGNLIFGLGFGIPLTDLYSPEGTIVREPHNSIVSVAARMGLIGIVTFAWIQVVLLRKWFFVYGWCKRNGATLWKNNMLILGTFTTLVWIFSIGEDTFEKPYTCIPYYFFWGVTLRVQYEILRGGVRLHEPASEGQMARVSQTA